MDELVTFRESQFINFRDYEFDGGAHHLYRWIVIKTYDLASAISDDKAVIAGVIGSVEYRDDYVGGGVDPDGDVHGPYWLTSISPDSYLLRDGSTFHRILDEWLGMGGVIPSGLRSVIDEALRPLYDPSISCYELPRLSDSALNDYADIHSKYHEFLFISRNEKKAVLLVASDD
ncbi:hypothetical protein [Nocardia sp. NRRL WC-3656]|uniref:hypothetical protein n=1 Tax=Nocardia sp. NRRL WC-3656 TaxID=1463824 RepID=UPI00068A8E8C|nr:hypothetical protein [Nocardia sp. NRRL WC-3656]